MTLNATTVKVPYNGDGSTTEFPVTFVYWDADDVRVILTDASGADTDWTRGTQYELDDGDGGTGTVTVNTLPIDYTPASNTKLTILSNLPDTQPTSLPTGGALPSASIERQLDQIVRLIQQRSEELDRTPKFGASEASSSYGDMPTLADRKSNYFAFDADGKPIASSGPTGDSSIPVSAFVETLLDDADQDAFIDTLFNGADTDAFWTTLTASIDKDAARTALGIVPTIYAEAKTSGGPTTVSTVDTVFTLDMGTVAAGDRLLVSGFATAIKSSTEGRTTVSVAKSSGTATIEAGNGASVLTGTDLFQPASSTYNVAASGTIQVTGSGTLVLKLQGLSAGSSADISGHLHVIVLRNS